MDIISDGIYNLIIFVLAVYVGYHVVSDPLDRKSVV